MINYQKIFFGLFLSLIFIFPKFVFAQVTNDVPPGGYTNLGNCSSYTTTVSQISNDLCIKIGTQLSAKCTNVKVTFFPDNNNSCTITISDGCTITCLSIQDYINNPSGDTSGDSNHGGAASVPLINPLKINSPQLLVGSIINSTLGIVGSIALLMFIYGGFTWLTSGGSAENVKKGREIIIWAVIGLVIVFLSYGLVTFLILNIK